MSNFWHATSSQIDLHRAAAAGVTCYCDCPWLCLKNQQTLQCLWLGQFYPVTIHVRFVMNHVAPSTSVSFCYQKESFLSCVIWGSKANCNIVLVQSVAALSTVFVTKTLCYFSLRFPTTNHPHLCLLHLQVIYCKFSQWGIDMIYSRLP